MKKKFSGKVAKEAKWSQLHQAEQACLHAAKMYDGIVWEIAKRSLSGEDIDYHEIDLFMSQFKYEPKIKNKVQNGFTAGIISHSWHKSKIVYQVSEDLNKTIQENAVENMTDNVMNSLPYSTVFVECGLESIPCDGFFFKFAKDKNDPSDQGRYYIEPVKNGYFCNVFTTKSGVLEIATPVSFDRVENAGSENRSTPMYVREALNIILYINRLYNIEKEVRVRSGHKLARKASADVTLVPVGTPDPIVYTKFRDFKYESDVNTTGKTGTHKRPHSRRGHWHSFWVGSKKNDTRHLIQKWIPETRVHSEESEEIATTVIQI